MDHEAIAELFERLAIKAGQAILQIRSEGVEVLRKGDDSPVTEADRAGEEIILHGLAEHLGEIPVIAEEAMAAGRQPDISGERFILVDPLDGTREFIKGNGDFTVNIALVEGRIPVVGAVLAPAQGRMWCGTRSAASAYDVEMATGTRSARQAIRCKTPSDPLRIVASASHRTAETEAFIAQFAGAETVSVGSSLKFCLLAEGKADLYPRFGRTMEWDTAAGDAVLRAAGGMTVTPDGHEFRYGKTAQAGDCDFANGWFICAGDGKLLADMPKVVLPDGAAES